MDKLIVFGASRLTAVMILIALVYFFTQSRKKRLEMAAFAVISLPAIYLVAKISSLLYFNPRPFVVENFAPLIPHVINNGFPSDHTLLSAAVAMVVIYYDKKLGAVLLMLALLVGAARVLAGVHHALDIMGSFAIVIVVSWLMHKYILPAVLRSVFFSRFSAIFSK